jgi:hypothetical protein
LVNDSLFLAIKKPGTNRTRKIVSRFLDIVLGFVVWK